MKLLELNWREFAGRTRTWERLAPSTHRALLDLRAGGVDGRLLGSDVPLLIREGFVSTSRGGAVVDFGPGVRPFLRAVRAMRRHRLLTAPSAHAVAAYISENLTRHERERLGEYGSHVSPPSLAARARPA